MQSAGLPQKCRWGWSPAKVQAVLLVAALVAFGGGSALAQPAPGGGLSIAPQPITLGSTLINPGETKTTVNGLTLTGSTLSGGALTGTTTFPGSGSISSAGVVTIGNATAATAGGAGALVVPNGGIFAGGAILSNYSSSTALGSGTLYGMGNDVSYSGSSASGKVVGIVGSPLLVGSGALSELQGGQFGPFAASTTTLTSLYGIVVSPQNQKSGLNTFAGVFSAPLAQASAALMYSFISEPLVTGGVTTAYGFYNDFRVATGGSVITNAFGLYLDYEAAGSFSGTITNRYGVYQADPAALNIFKGVLGADGGLSVTGGSTFTGTVAITGALSPGTLNMASSTTGAGTQTFVNSPCTTSLINEQWTPITIVGQTGTWYIPACK